MIDPTHPLAEKSAEQEECELVADGIEASFQSEKRAEEMRAAFSHWRDGNEIVCPDAKKIALRGSVRANR